jgi:hypothetical protein
MSTGPGRSRLVLLGVLVVSACGGGGGGNGGSGGSGGKGGTGGTSGTAGVAGRGDGSGGGGIAGSGGGSGGSGVAGGGSGGSGATGTGGVAGNSGAAGSGGGSAGVGGSGGGGAGTGGTTGAGGVAGTGGAAGTSGRGGSTAGTGGATGTGGAAGTGGGAAGTAGGTVGTAGRGGTTGAGGAAGTGGGAAGTGGSAAGTSGGVAGTGGNCVTSVSGTVYDPAGVNPLYNVSVFSPTTALTPFTEGVSCDRCAPLPGTPAASALTGTQGNFTMTGIPAGTNVPLVFQIGKWRRQVTIPNVVACADNPLTDINLTRLPRTQAEGHIPKIAMSTGGADALECFLRRIGIADTEFTSDSSGGRVHLYAGGAGTNSFMNGGAFSAATTLWSNPTKLATYDMIGFSCEGSVSGFRDQKPQSSIDNVTAYANSGGRLFLSHQHYYWLQQSSEFSSTASYVGALTPPTGSASDPIDLTINTTFPKGMALSQWLAGPIVMASPTAGRITAAGLEHSVTSVTAPTTEWIYLAMNPQDSQRRRSEQFLSFPTQVGMPEASQCGKVLFTDMHIKQSLNAGGGDDSDPGKPFPSGCKTNAMTPQMKAMEFLFFDLGACL